MKHTQGGKDGVSRIAGAVLAGLMTVAANGATGGENGAPADFHVAVSGKDTSPGTAKAPFATLAKAREAVRGKIKEGLAKDLVLEIRGGTYPVTETLTFGPEDSGTEKCSITYAAAPGEKVVLGGGHRRGAPDGGGAGGGRDHRRARDSRPRRAAALRGDDSEQSPEVL